MQGVWQHVTHLAGAERRDVQVKAEGNVAGDLGQATAHVLTEAFKVQCQQLRWPVHTQHHWRPSFAAALFNSIAADGQLSQLGRSLALSSSEADFLSGQCCEQRNVPVDQVALLHIALHICQATPNGRRRRHISSAARCGCRFLLLSCIAIDRAGLCQTAEGSVRNGRLTAIALWLGCSLP